MGRRILVKGASGAGKTTLAAELGRRLDLPCFELDAFHHGPNWRAASATELQSKVLAVLDDSRGWIVDGNYDSKLGTIVADRAELIVWLDLPLPTKIWRLVGRSGWRLLRGEALWNGNRETLKGLFWGRDALFAWAIGTHFRQRQHWPSQLAGRPLARLCTPNEVERWLGEFCASQTTRA